MSKFNAELKTHMTIKNNIILTQQEIQHKIRRIAFQIYESNVRRRKLF